LTAVSKAASAAEVAARRSERAALLLAALHAQVRLALAADATATDAESERAGGANRAARSSPSWDRRAY